MRRALTLAFVFATGIAFGHIVTRSKPPATKSQESQQPPAIILVNRPVPSAHGGRSVHHLRITRESVKDKILWDSGTPVNQYKIPELGAEHWVVSVDGHSFIAIDEGISIR